MTWLDITVVRPVGVISHSGGQHADAEGFVVTVDLGPAGGFASHPQAADAGDGGDNLVAQDEQGGDGAGGLGWGFIASGAARFDDEVFAAEFAQVVRGLAWRVV